MAAHETSFLPVFFLFHAIASVYSKVYRYLPLPVRRAARFIYHSIGGGKADPRAEESIASFYRSMGIIGNGDLVFDIGANIGVYSSAFAKLGARVVAVEPEPSCIEILNQKFGKGSGVVVVPKGVGEKAGELELHVSGTKVASTFSKEFMQTEERDFKTDYVRTVKVPITTLDLLIEEHGLPKYCKIDVEGFERPVLSGLSQKIPVISFEFHSSLMDEAAVCLNLLEKRGYKFNLCLEQRFVLQSWVSASEIAAKIKQMQEENAATGARSSAQQSGDIFARLN